MKVFKTIKKGYFGNAVIVTFLNREIFRVHRSYIRESFFLFGLRILRKELPLKYKLGSMNNNFSVVSDVFNKQESPHNLACSKRVIFVVDCLETSGGVESRLYNQACYFKSIGYEPLIITEYNLNNNLKEFRNIVLDFKAPNFCCWIENIVKLLNPEIVEFQFKEFRYIYDIDLSVLKKVATVGVCVHGITNIDHNIMEQFHYRVYSCANSINKFNDAHHIPNFIKNTSFVWEYNRQSKALFVSRIVKDKLNTLENFIRICNENNVKYEIAGPIDYNNSKVVKFISKLEKGVLIGEIDTFEYLLRYANDYLFVAGVGQVPIEAASFGIPALVLTHHKDSTYSAFLTEKNLEFLKNWNFVINRCPKESFLGNVNEFFADVNDGKIEKYTVSKFIKNLLSMEKVMSEYMDIVKQCR